RSLELVEAHEVGELGMVQHTGGGDHDVDVVAVPALRLDVPRAVVEPAARDRVAEPDLPLDVVLVRDPLEVPLDLVARRETVAPFGRAVGAGSCPTVCAGVISSAGIQKATVVRTTPDNHLAVSPDCRVILSASRRVGEARSCPTVRARAVPSAAVQIV